MARRITDEPAAELSQRYGPRTGRMVKLLRAATAIHRTRVGLDPESPRARRLRRASSALMGLVARLERN